jgi:hypothetical protein
MKFKYEIFYLSAIIGLTKLHFKSRIKFEKNHFLYTILFFQNIPVELRQIISIYYGKYGNIEYLFIEFVIASFEKYISYINEYHLHTFPFEIFANNVDEFEYGIYEIDNMKELLKNINTNQYITKQYIIEIDVFSRTFLVIRDD